MSILSETPDTKEPIGTEEIYDLLKDDPDPNDDKEKGEKPEEEVKEEEEEVKEEEKEEKEEEVDELAELEKELKEDEEPTDDELELITPVRRTEILKKYPNVFKDFPYLEKAYYRERKYSEIFPSPADAQVALEKAETLSNFEQELLGGDLTKVLESVKKENGDSFNKIADNYLRSLSNVDERAYHHVIGVIVRNTIGTMISSAEELDEDDKNRATLMNTARILSQFVFGTTKIKGNETLSKAEVKSDREKELEERENKFKQQKFEDARGGLETKVEATLKNTISKHIDPKNNMTEYVRRTAEKEALETVYSLISKDSRFASLRDKLWQYAEKNNFNAESIGRIRSAYLSKATTLLPSVIKKARNEALKGMGKRVKEEKEEEQQESRKSGAPDKKPDSSSRREKGKIPQGMSNRDYIMSD